MLTKKDFTGDTTRKEWTELLKEILFLPVLILAMWFIGTSLNDFFTSDQPPIQDIVSDQVDTFLYGEELKEIIRLEVKKELAKTQ